MAVTYDQLMSYPIPEARQALSPRDCILYALGAGLGSNYTDERELRFVYEKDLVALPTLANVLAYPGFWQKAPDTGIDWKRSVHGEQAFTLHRPLPVEANLIGRTRMTGIADKGPERGAIVFSEREVVDADTGEPMCTINHTTFCRGNGGCGGDDPRPRQVHQTPERVPDLACDLPIAPSAALLYRLNGDMNPLHADPAVARAAGFDRPILHGLATLAHACHAIVRAALDFDASRIRGMEVRFTAPVYPGETLRTDVWLDDDHLSYRSSVVEREMMVLDNGRVDLWQG